MPGTLPYTTSLEDRPSEGEEDREMVKSLFDFVNEVTEELFAKPRRHREMARKINREVRKKSS